MKCSRIATGTIGALLTVCLLTTGCAVFQGKGVQEEYRGELKADRTIVLTQHVRLDLLRNDERHNYAELALSLWGDDTLLLEQTVARVGGKVTEHPGFRFGQVEGRATHDGNRVWFVDQDAQKIVASFDFCTKRATGPSEVSPEWAVLRGGVRLESLKP